VEVLSQTKTEEQIILAMGRTPATYQTQIQKTPEDLSKKFPDLTSDDLGLVANYYKPFSDKERSLANTAEHKLIERILDLYNKASQLPQNSKAKVSFQARLINFQMIVRSNINTSRIISKLDTTDSMTDQAFDQTATLNEIRTRPITSVRPEELPEEIKTILENLEISSGQSFWSFIKESVNSITFIPQLEKSIKLMSQEDHGTTEELTKTVFIDPLGMFNLPSSKWAIAEYIAHEAGHIKWYHDHGNDKSKTVYLYNERNSDVISYIFNNALLNSNLDITERTRENISERIKISIMHIQIHNKTLGYSKKDYSLH